MAKGPEMDQMVIRNFVGGIWRGKEKDHLRWYVSLKAGREKRFGNWKFSTNGFFFFGGTGVGERIIMACCSQKWGLP